MVIRRRSDPNGKSRTRGADRSASSRWTPPLCANASSAPSVGSPTQRHRPCKASSRASPHSAAARSNGSTSASAPASSGRSDSSSVPPGAQPAFVAVRLRVNVRASRAVIWFVVIVPVLSEQITVVAPSVSTDSRCLTSAPRCAILVALIASESVSVGSSPSGTSATITPIPNKKPLRVGVPSPSATPKKATPAPIAKAAINRTARSRSTRSGVGRRWTSPVRRAMSPSRVRAPVATTTARAAPDVTYVPAKTSPGAASGSSPGSAHASAVRDIGTDSPVSVDSSTRSASACVTRASAEIRSPSTSTTTSPRTSSPAGIDTRRPSRRTVASTVSSSRSALVACSARSSCANEKTPFKTTTIAIAIASCGISPTNASTAATHSSSAKKCVSCASSRESELGPSGSGIAVRPVGREQSGGLVAVQPFGPRSHRAKDLVGGQRRETDDLALDVRRDGHPNPLLAPSMARAAA